MALELVGSDHSNLSPAEMTAHLPLEMPPPTPLVHTIDTMLAYANHLEGQTQAVQELAEATYANHTMCHRRPWATCERQTCVIARNMLPY